MARYILATQDDDDGYCLNFSLPCKRGLEYVHYISCRGARTLSKAVSIKLYLMVGAPVLEMRGVWSASSL